LDNALLQNPNASPVASTIYSVVVSDANGCGTDTATVDITVAPPPTITGDTSYTTGANQAVQLSLSGGTSYVWFPSTGLSCFDCASPTATLNQTTQYTVTVTDANGCTNTILVRVIVEDLCESVHVPNAFSPNGDGINDVFNFINTNPDNQILDFKIFDRWGNVIFSDNSPNSKGWDGMDRFGKVYDMGVFTYYVRFKCTSGEKVVKGNLTLLP
jgi:gliding motility-associated-like protein